MLGPLQDVPRGSDSTIATGEIIRDALATAADAGEVEQ